MWVFDGEGWTEEGAERKNTAAVPEQTTYDMFWPEAELQIVPVEINPRDQKIPPFPLP